jgi:hypothetical protein
LRAKLDSKGVVQGLPADRGRHKHLVCILVSKSTLDSNLLKRGTGKVRPIINRQKVYLTMLLFAGAVAGLFPEC